MKRLLKLTAIIETATGLGLVAVPSVVVRLLLGSPLGTSAAVMLARVAGAALLALGVVCWLACDDTQSRATRGLVVAMLMYNLSPPLSSLSPASACSCTASCCGLRWFSTRRWAFGVSPACDAVPRMRQWTVTK